MICRSQPKPVQRPHPPIWFGGQAPKALARAERHGDAFLGAGSSTTANFAEAVKTLRRELDEQGKDPTGFPIGKRVYLMVDDDADRARERVLAGLHRIYGQLNGIDAVPVSGTADDVATGVREVIDALALKWSCSTRSAAVSPRTASKWNALPQTSFRNWVEPRKSCRSCEFIRDTPGPTYQTAQPRRRRLDVVPRSLRAR